MGWSSLGRRGFLTPELLRRVVAVELRNKMDDPRWITEYKTKISADTGNRSVFVYFDTETLAVPISDLDKPLEYVSSKYIRPVVLGYWARHVDPSLYERIE